MLQVEHLSYSYNDQEVVKNVSFKLEAGKAYALIGASGSGKSTLLKLVYGLLDAEKGTVFWNERQVLGPKNHLVPGMDFMKYLAQDFDLMPYVSAAENVGRFLSNFYLKEKAVRIAELLELVDLTAFADVKARFLSGGQMQRIALARVLALAPEVLLLDEPFSHIDSHQKSRLARHLFRYCKSRGITVLFTSHTPEEALMYAEEVLVLKEGRLIVQDTPQHIYELPTDEYTARLTGEVNVLPVRYLGVANDEVLFLRPHQLEVSQEGLLVEVVHSYFTGRVYLIEAVFKGHTYFFEHPNPINAHVRIKIDVIR